MTGRPALPENVEFSNAGAVDTNGTGWFIGFSEWSKSKGINLRYVPGDQDLRGLCVKWFMHAAGDPNGHGKPLSEGRTFSILAGAASEFRIEFSRSPGFEPAFTLAHTLRKPGDFVIWGEGLHHRWFSIKPACIMTIRWSPQDGVNRA
jgi:hypothetical protein